MANEKRLIDANEALRIAKEERYMWVYDLTDLEEFLTEVPTVDAVEVPDKDLLKAIKLLIKQYEHSKNSDYVHSPVAHAFFHTWKQLDGRRE